MRSLRCLYVLDIVAEGTDDGSYNLRYLLNKLRYCCYERTGKCYNDTDTRSMILGRFSVIASTSLIMISESSQRAAAVLHKPVGSPTIMAMAASTRRPMLLINIPQLSVSYHYVRISSGSAWQFREPARLLSLTRHLSATAAYQAMRLSGSS